MLGVCRVITGRITGSMPGHHTCSINQLGVDYTSVTRTKSVTCQNPESRIMSPAQISGQNSESKVISLVVALDLGVGQGD